MNRELIDVYVSGGKKLVDAFRGLTPNQLFAVPVPGTWSLQQIAVHLMDSDLIASDRMKRIAAMDKPLLCGYDETAFNLLPGINDLCAQKACEVFAVNREMTAIILRRLPDSTYLRFGIHNEIGKVTLEEMVKKYIDHLDSHLAHVYHKRELLGAQD